MYEANEPPELTDAEINRFFEYEAIKKVGLGALSATIDTVISEQLDHFGAFSVYDPDPVKLLSKKDAVFTAILAREAAGQSVDFSIEAENLHTWFEAEYDIFSDIKFALLAKTRCNATLEKEAAFKKEIHAKLLVNHFDEAWIKTLNELLAGPLLDITNPDDFVIYSQALEPPILPDDL